MFKELLLSTAMIALCLSARAEESAEAGKARIDMQFKEDGGEGAPKDSGAVYAGEGRKHDLKLTQAEAKRPQAIEVQVPGVISGRSLTASDKAAACAKANTPSATVFGATVGGAVGTMVGVIGGFVIGGIPGAAAGAAVGAGAGAGAGGLVGSVGATMICRAANGLPALDHHWGANQN